jgi:hypothetical protein
MTHPNDIANWIVALISSLATLIITLLVEPFKAAIGARFRRRSIQKMVYQEIVRMWYQILFLEIEGKNHEASPTSPPKRLEFSPSAYNYARTQLDVFYQLEEASDIDGVYDDLKWMFKSVDVSTVNAYQLQMARQSIALLVLYPRADKKLFRRLNVLMVNQIETMMKTKDA